MGDIDPANILEPGSARITRGVPPQRLRSTPGHKEGGGEVNDLASLEGSPVIKVELSSLVSPVSDSSTSLGEGEYEETPINEGRHIQISGGGVPPSFQLLGVFLRKIWRMTPLMIEIVGSSMFVKRWKDMFLTIAKISTGLPLFIQSMLGFWLW